MMNDKIGFDCVQILMRCNSANELDEAIRIINNTYPVLHEHLETLDEINNNNDTTNMNGKRFCFIVGKGGGL